MRAAVLADIHGNLPALDAVLRDVEDAGVDVIVLNGDIADGAMPSQTLDRLRALGDRALWVRGNSDRWLVDAFDQKLTLPGYATSPPPGWFEWCASQIQRDHRNLLADLPVTVSLDIDGIGMTTFCHATARDDNEYILVDSPVELYDAAFAAVPDATVVLGHTHMPFDRLAAGKRFVNAGSVGLGYGHTGASWLLLGPQITLRRTQYDTSAAIAILSEAATTMPWIDDVVAGVRSPETDAAALAAFTETVNQQQGR